MCRKAELLLLPLFRVQFFKVEAERAYHQRAVQILEQLEGEVSSFHLNCLMTFVLPSLRCCHCFHIFLQKAENTVFGDT